MKAVLYVVANAHLVCVHCGVQKIHCAVCYLYTKCMGNAGMEDCVYFSSSESFNTFLFA